MCLVSALQLTPNQPASCRSFQLHTRAPGLGPVTQFSPVRWKGSPEGFPHLAAIQEARLWTCSWHGHFEKPKLKPSEPSCSLKGTTLTTAKQRLRGCGQAAAQVTCPLCLALQLTPRNRFPYCVPSLILQHTHLSSGVMGPEPLRPAPNRTSIPAACQSVTAHFMGSGFPTVSLCPLRAWPRCLAHLVPLVSSLVSGASKPFNKYLLN